MANIFSIIEGLEVTKEDIIEAELFAEQQLSARFPTYDFRQGTAIRDMTVRPNATLLALLNKAIQHYFNDTDILNITNDTDNEVVDKRLSNFFLKRKTGAKAIIQTRLFFSFPTQTPISISIPLGATFSVDDEVQFSPQSTVFIEPPSDNKDPEKFYFQYDSAQSLWYVDIPMESAGNDEKANLSEGDLLYFTIFSPFFLKANILYLSQVAVKDETNEEMLERSYTAVSTRNLINAPSIISRISDKFNYVNDINPVGMGNTWMYRDIIKIKDPDTEEVMTYHRGGHVDIYVNSAAQTQVHQLTAEVDRETGEGVAFYVEGPIYSLERVEESPVEKLPDTVPVFDGLDFKQYSYEAINVSDYTNNIPDSPVDDIGLSGRQMIKIKFLDELSVGDTASFGFRTFLGLTGIETALQGEEESVVCADYLVRAYDTQFVYFNVKTRNGTHVNAGEVEKFLISHIDSIPRGGSIFMSDLVNIMSNNGFTDIQMPLDISLVNYSRKIKGSSTEQDNVTVTPLIDEFSLEDTQKFKFEILNVEEVTS